jgi:hypothetical protein
LQVTAADDDYTHNNIAHEFLSTKSQLLDSVFRVFTLLLPDSLFTFSAAKYCRQGHIKPHDDRAYTQVRVRVGRLCGRSHPCHLADWLPASGADTAPSISHAIPEQQQIDSRLVFCRQNCWARRHK